MSLSVDVHESPDEALPSSLTAGIVIFKSILCGTLWKGLGKRLSLARGGYDGIDALWLLLLFFSGQHTSLREFVARSFGFSKKLAAVAGRKGLPSTSSMSRLLGSLEMDTVRDWSWHLLVELPGVLELLDHESMKARCRQATAWHLLDFDPTKLAIRQRRLPAGEGLPDPRRRATMLAAPGHRGRKRGEVVTREVILDHAGSGAVLHISAEQGNGSPQCFDEAMSVVVQLREALPDEERVLVRADGEYGGAAPIALCAGLKIPFLTRLRGMRVIESSHATAQLREATWQPVASSMSGPQRFAADIGMFDVSEEGAEEPVMCRIVVSRYAVPSGSDRGRGALLDNQRVEAFAAPNVPYESFSASDIVNLYYGRCGQENRIGRHKAELNIERPFSFNLAGQLLAWLCARVVWNTIAATSPKQEPVVVTPDPPSCVAPPIPSAWRGSSEPLAPEGQSLEGALRALNWATLLRKRKGWKWEVQNCTLVNADGTSMGFVGLYGRQLRFRSEGGVSQASISLAKADAQLIERAKRGDTSAPRPLPWRPPNDTPDGSIRLPSSRMAKHRRQLWRSALTARVDLRLKPLRHLPTEQGPSEYARRQKRRLTANQHLARYQASCTVDASIYTFYPV